jgi:hypothetical protein
LPLIILANSYSTFCDNSKKISFRDKITFHCHDCDFFIFPTHNSNNCVQLGENFQKQAHTAAIVVVVEVRFIGCAPCCSSLVCALSPYHHEMVNLVSQSNEIGTFVAGAIFLTLDPLVNKVNMIKLKL